MMSPEIGRAAVRELLVEHFGGPEVLQVIDVPVPEVGAGQVRIVVRAAAVNPVDVATRAGALRQAGLHDALPVRLGWDVYGHVDTLGAGVRRLRTGQPVIGLSDRLAAASKTHADQVVLDEAAVAAVPAELDAAIAATLPLAGLTAWQALNRLDLRPGQTVLITGAGGAVGSLAVQLADLRGLRVVAAGRQHDAQAAVDLGAERFIESNPDLALRVRQYLPGGVDGSLDAAGLDNPSLDSVRDGGEHVNLNVTHRPAPLRAVRSQSLAVAADWQQLSVLASLAASGALRVRVATEFALSDVQAAHELLAAGGVRGRILLRP
jgi:NADPH2:quinone reductase